jgi:hypothetical protein
MSEAFGAYDKASATATVPDGTYAVTVKSVQVVKRNGEPLIEPKSGKVKIAIVVTVASGEHAGVDLKRTTTVSYGQNTENGHYAVLASFIEAAGGPKCGDPEQKKIGEAQLKGKPLLVTVLENDKGYADIVRFKPAQAVQRVAAAPPGDPLDQDLGHRGRRAVTEVDPLALLTAGQRDTVLKKLAEAHVDVTTPEGAALVRGWTRNVMPDGAEQLDAAHMPAFFAKIADRKAA